MTENEINMQKVLNGEDINVQLPNEFGEHYYGEKVLKVSLLLDG